MYITDKGKIRHMMKSAVEEARTGEEQPMRSRLDGEELEVYDIMCNQYKLVREQLKRVKQNA